MDDRVDLVVGAAESTCANLHWCQHLGLQIDLVSQSDLLTQIGFVCIRGGEIRREVDRPFLRELATSRAFSHLQDDLEIPSQLLVE